MSDQTMIDEVLRLRDEKMAFFEEKIRLERELGKALEHVAQLSAALAGSRERIDQLCAQSAGRSGDGEVCGLALDMIEKWPSAAPAVAREILRLCNSPSPAVTDTARLDWLEQRADGFANIDRISSVSMAFNGKPTLREAIDAARTPSPTAPQRGAPK